MKPAFLLVAICLNTAIHTQEVSANLSKAWTVFESDSQLRSAIASIYVMEEETGKVVFDRNSRIGLAPASTQKIITAAAAYEFLGRDFRYKTTFSLGPHNGGQKELRIEPSGDPTLGSWRWKQTAADSVLKRLTNVFAGSITSNSVNITVSVPAQWTGATTPGGWIWDDVGNYYGVGAEALNWRENQYDLILRSDSTVGGRVYVVDTKPQLYYYSIRSEARSGPKGSGDNAYIYFGKKNDLIVRGSIPAGEKGFTIAGAMPSAQEQFVATLTAALQTQKVKKSGASASLSHIETSPSLDSIVYPFLKRSTNLYGEALVKQIAIKSDRAFTSEDGADAVAKYWSGKPLDIDRTELNMVDGAGLSPLNRVTTHAQVAVLQYAKKQPWFDGYYNAFPEFNGMKLKSGTINRVKSFCGYHTSKAGEKYIVSFIVNNYSGASSALVQKMYKVLDVLK